MDAMQSIVIWQFPLVYLDDIITFTSGKGKHISHVLILSALLQKASVNLNLNKFKFFTDDIDCFGHFVRPGSRKFSSSPTGPMRGF